MHNDSLIFVLKKQCWQSCCKKNPSWQKNLRSERIRLDHKAPEQKLKYSGAHSGCVFIVFQRERERERENDARLPERSWNSFWLYMLQSRQEGKRRLNLQNKRFLSLNYVSFLLKWHTSWLFFSYLLCALKKKSVNALSTSVSSSCADKPIFPVSQGICMAVCDYTLCLWGCSLPPCL